MTESLNQKTCTGCKELKLMDQFPGGSNGRVHTRCRDCRRSQCRAWAKTHQGKTVKRDGILRRKFGLTREQYNEMKSSQGHVCAICGQAEMKVIKGTLADLCVDHDHVTSKVRALLCSGCNVGLGNFSEDTDRMERAIAYLRLHSSLSQEAAQ